MLSKNVCIMCGVINIQEMNPPILLECTRKLALIEKLCLTDWMEAIVVFTGIKKLIHLSELRILK